MKKTIIVLFLTILLAGNLLAQWSSDPAENNVICDLAGEQAIPKVVNGPTGDTYIGFFSNDSGNYDVRLQRLDPQGNELWENQGILISDNPAMTWLTDWDMTVDEDNHAILTFQDIRNAGNNNIYAYRIAPDGTFIWGSDGIELSNTTAFSASPKVVVTSAGNVVVAWQEDAISLVQKIAPDGTLLWGATGITISSANTISWPQPFAIDNDEILLKYFDDSGQPWAPTRHCYMQRYDSDGNAVWTSPTVVSNAGGISAWTQVFNIISDENNGCFITWHDSRGGGTISYPFVQHINSDGSVGFAANGVQLSTETNRQNFYPESVYNAAAYELTTYWSQTDGNQNDHGITGQKIDAEGNLIWGANGNNIIPVSDLYVLPFAVRQANDDVIILYEKNVDTMNSYVEAMKLDADGNFVWPGDSVQMCSIASEKVHSVASQFSNGHIIASWEDNRNGAKDIFAQNINLDGTLGIGLPVFLTSFEGELIDTGIELTWSTFGEPDVTGWNVLRSETSFEEAIQLNMDMIPATGSPTTAADYTFLDEQISMSHTYFYWLESIFNSSNPLYWGPIMLMVPTVLNPPQNVEVDPNTGTVSWDPPEPYPGAELLGYNIYRDGTLLGMISETFCQLENLINGVVYNVGISAVYDVGESEIVEVEFEYTGTGAGNNIIATTELTGNYPNPFNPETTISFSLNPEDAEDAELIIFNIKGQKIKTFRINSSTLQSINSITWNGTDNSNRSVSSGVYFYKMRAGARYTNTRKMILMK